MFRFMIEDLHNLEYLGQTLNTQNSYQYGPVCIDKKFRGSGLLEVLFETARYEMSKRFDILVTFVNKNNPRSYTAHKRKLGLTVIKEFEFKGNEYYEFVYDVSKSVNISSEEKVFYTGKPFVCTVDYPIEYLSYEDLLDELLMEEIYADKEKNYYWTDDLSSAYYIAQAKAGFIAVTMEHENKVILAPEIQKSYAILNFKDLHISRKVKKLLKAKNLQLEIGTSFDEVQEHIKRFHSFTWLNKTYLNALKSVHDSEDTSMEIVTALIRDKGKAIAGEFGYIIGNTYTSLAAFSSREKGYENYGTAQLVLLAQHLEEKGFAFLNLGQSFMPYKIDLGAKVYERKIFLEMWKKAII
ncbi:MAG: Leucyl/phenylalanyl-tRNA--protein transferase (EC [uncultured Sulfurovum sp.]|uniref:Leucyl/phenylalanyl-tRNA--protein transferase (EC) n=1 Tax=uncultured Sulfurovum sp. TaxID=269237 RepID=A0A6S6SR52_9BACT|nr:MAG: Leucyl/phenylalanyl-tRNA--protein transferase (EC [uncultured Sulfurovum sp.]